MSEYEPKEIFVPAYQARTCFMRDDYETAVRYVRADLFEHLEQENARLLRAEDEYEDLETRLRETQAENARLREAVATLEEAYRGLAEEVKG